MDDPKAIPEDWTTSELFNYCRCMNLISSEDTFEQWMNDRTDLLRIVKEDIENN